MKHRRVEDAGRSHLGNRTLRPLNSTKDGLIVKRHRIAGAGVNPALLEPAHYQIAVGDNQRKEKITVGSLGEPRRRCKPAVLEKVLIFAGNLLAFLKKGGQLGQLREPDRRLQFGHPEIMPQLDMVILLIRIFALRSDDFHSLCKFRIIGKYHSAFDGRYHLRCMKAGGGDESVTQGWPAIKAGSDALGAVDIMGKIFHAAEAVIEPAAAAAPAPSTAADVNVPPAATASASASKAAAPAAPVDVDATLTAMAAGKGGGGNWRTSIVDLLKLLDLDPSLAARKQLAVELSVHAGADGSAEENIALHKAVMQKLAENGGVVPDSLKG